MTSLREMWTAGCLAMTHAVLRDVRGDCVGVRVTVRYARAFERSRAEADAPEARRSWSRVSEKEAFDGSRDSFRIRRDFTTKPFTSLVTASQSAPAAVEMTGLPFARASGTTPLWLASRARPAAPLHLPPRTDEATRRQARILRATRTDAARARAKRQRATSGPCAAMTACRPATRSAASSTAWMKTSSPLLELRASEEQHARCVGEWSHCGRVRRHAGGREWRVRSGVPRLSNDLIMQSPAVDDDRVGIPPQVRGHEPLNRSWRGFAHRHEERRHGR